MDSLVPPAVLPIDASDQLTTDPTSQADVDEFLEVGLDRREWLVFKQASTFVGKFGIVAHIDGEWWETVATAHPILGVNRSPPRQLDRDAVRDRLLDHDVYHCQL